MNAIATRVPPHDLRAERALIELCLIDHDVHAELAQAVRASDFYKDAHALIWEAIQSLDRDHVRADSLTLRSRLESAGQLQRVGGDDYLLGLHDGALPSLVNAEHFAQRIRECASVRRTIHAAHEIAAEGYSPLESVPDYLSRAEKTIVSAVDGHVGSAEPVHVSAAIDEAITAMVGRAEGIGTPSSTGLSDLDFALGNGLWPGEVTVLSGTPGTGKTALALQIARHVDRERGPVLFHSLEMPKRQLANRLISQEARVDGNRIRIMRLNGDDMAAINAAGQAISAGRLHIEDASSPTIGDIARNARRMKRKQGLALLVIDYLQLVRPVERGDSREREVNDVSKAMLALAKDLEIPILALASLNRASESRGKAARPTIRQLRESGAIESDAHNVLLLYREDLESPECDRKGLCDVIIGKQRNGMTGDVTLRFVKEHTRFVNFEQWRTDNA